MLATVVAREAPQSVRSGSKALILPDATLLGWVGGGCVRPTVLRESLNALRDGRPRLLRINPGAEPDARDDVRVYAMTCQGEGAVDIYLEPVLPRLDLLVLGRTPVAEALVRLARPLEINVRVADPHAHPERFPGVELVTDYARVPALIGARSYVVVATMGEGDEEALEAALSTDVAYVGLVASRKKAASLFAYLRSRGLPPERIKRVKAPAGLDLGAVTPAEIALTILAEIVQLQRAATHLPHAAPASVAVPAEQPSSSSTDRAQPESHEPSPAERVIGAPVAAESAAAVTALDPVCGMAVEVRTARHAHVHEGRTHYFCCPHCKAAFVKDPQKYGVAAEG